MVYMIDDSDDESYMTHLYFDRQQVGPTLKHFYDLSAFVDHVTESDEFDPIGSILVVDLNLRSRKGTDLIEEIRGEGWGVELVAGICSGSEDPADQRSAIAAGADFFVGKPLDRDMVSRICEIEPRLEASSDSDQPLTIDRLMEQQRG